MAQHKSTCKWCKNPVIQVTRWLDPEELVYHNKRFIKINEWIYIEAKRITEATNVKTSVESYGGQLAIFRNKIR